MRAMSLDSPAPATAAPLRLQQREERAIGPGEIAVRTLACGVCRTDLQLVEGDLDARRLPIVPGHQVVGVVSEVGQDVASFAIGDRVGLAWLAWTCGVCDQCLRGRENLCRAARFRGWDDDGGFAERVIADAAFAFPLPAAFETVDAAPLLCGGVIGYRSLKRARVEPGAKVGLFGFGASASLAIQVAVGWGCRVFVHTRSESERARALGLGAEWAGGYEERSPTLLDAAVTFAPSGDVVRAALESLDRGGTVAINAIHLDSLPAMAYASLWWERNVVSVANFTRDDAREFLELAATLPIRTTYDAYPLEHANEALVALRDGRVRGAAVLVV
jgi:propanol-preferring alcohol dehydrogenase